MKRGTGVLMIALALAGCDSTGPADVVGDVDGVDLIPPGQIEYTSDTIPITPEPDAAAGAAIAAAELEYEIVQRARVSSPDVTCMVDGDEVRVQANDIVVDASGRRAYIAYNCQGEPWVGALQFLDITDKDEPVFDGDAFRFEYMDINALYLDGNHLLLAGAIQPDYSDGSRSFAMRLDLRTRDREEMMASIVFLPSYAATGITRFSNRYYVSVGARDGGIHVLDMDLEPVDGMDRGDVRDIEGYNNGFIALAGSTDTDDPSGVLVSSGSGVGSVQSIALDNDFGSDYHKATIEVYEGTIALLGLSEAGWSVYDMRSPQTPLAHVGNPACTDGNRCNTNSVSTDGDLIFTANGQYGFRVFRPRSKDGFDDLETMGRYDVQADDGFQWDASSYSANHVELKSRNLFVASGLLGVFIYSLDN